MSGTISMAFRLMRRDEMKPWRSVFATILLLSATPAMLAASALAQGTLTTPTTPTVPSGRPVGQSTIISPAVSSPLLPSSGLAGSGRPCSGSATSFGSISGNAGVGTPATGTQSNTGLPAATNQPSSGSIRGVNPSVTPGLPGSC
jgi:hypothetical protein